MKDGKATGEYEDFLAGFVTPEGNVGAAQAGVAVAKDGSLMVTDDGWERSGGSLSPARSEMAAANSQATRFLSGHGIILWRWAAATGVRRRLLDQL